MHPSRIAGAPLEDVGESAEGGPGPGDSEPVWRARADRRRARSLTREGPRSALVVAGLVGLVALPLIVALVALRHPTWVPTLDLAMTELRVRDVASSHPPLIGLPGRIGTLVEQGSHPGPVSFWAMWPFYQLFGASAWALQAAAVSLHVLAMGAFLWIAHRRGGIGLALGGAAVLAILVRTYEVGTLAEPWNLFLPLLWWMVFLLAVWSVLCGDVPLLSVAVFAGSFCMQTHVSYVGLTGGLGILAVAAGLLTVNARRRDPRARQEAIRWCLIAAAVGAVLWVPPVIDQLTSSPGNLSILRDYFGDPPEASVGLRQGVELLLVRLDPWSLVTEHQTTFDSLSDASQATGGSLVPGSLVLAAWVGAVVAAWRMRHRALLRLHLVVGVALVLGAATASRIFGFVWYYLMLWAWGTTALLLLGLGWTAAALVGNRLGAPTRRSAATAGGIALVVVTLASTALLVRDAVDVEVPAPRLSATVDRLVPPTVAALARGAASADGRDGHYLVTWSDAESIGSQGLGLVNELERNGFEVGVLANYRAPATQYRVIEPVDATAIVHLATGVNIEKGRAEPGYREVAFVDARTTGERAEYRRLRSRVIDELRRAGRSELVPLVDENVFAAAIDTRVPRHTRELVSRMLDLGLPAAVFVGPPGSR
jgi:hypothetical protein